MENWKDITIIIFSGSNYVYATETHPRHIKNRDKSQDNKKYNCVLIKSVC